MKSDMESDLFYYEAPAAFKAHLKVIGDVVEALMVYHNYSDCQLSSIVVLRYHLTKTHKNHESTG